MVVNPSQIVWALAQTQLGRAHFPFQILILWVGVGELRMKIAPISLPGEKNLYITMDGQKFLSSNGY